MRNFFLFFYCRWQKCEEKGSDVMKKKPRKLALSILGILIILLLLWRIYELLKPSGAAGSPRQKALVAVEVEDIRIEPIRELGEFTGSIKADYEFQLRSRLTGRLKQLNIKEGDQIAVNEEIGRIEEAEFEQSLLAAEANLATARAKLVEAEQKKAVADLEFERVQALYEKEYISLSEYEKGQLQHGASLALLETAAAQVRQQEAAVRLAEINLENTRITAPRAGIISEKFIDEGSLLSANSPLVSIIGIDQVSIRAGLAERLYNRIAIGQQAYIKTDAFPDEEFIGRVSLLAPVINQDTRLGEMEISINNTDLRLKPGMFCHLWIVLAEEAKAQTVPSSAIISNKGDSGLYLLNEAENNAVWTPVIMGIISDDRTQILKPQIVDPIITLGQYQVKDGSQVKPVYKDNK
jgi:RND family efflux transporter MFP subunit